MIRIIFRFRRIIPLLALLMMQCSRNIVIHEVPSIHANCSFKAQSILDLSERPENYTGIDLDSSGNLVILHRAGHSFNNASLIDEDTVAIYSLKDHRLLRTWGAGQFVVPHGMTVDDRDAVWITDTGQNKVFKFSPTGELLNPYGEDYSVFTEACLRLRNILPGLSCFLSKKQFARPTDVEVFSDGSFVVSDSYRNNRIVRMDAQGNVIWEVNRAGNEPGAFHLPHDLALDDRERILVADRRNSRIQLFNKDGQFLETWDRPELGRPYAIDAAAGRIYVVDAGDSYEFDGGIERSRLLMLDSDGRLISSQEGFGSGIGEMRLPHDVAVSANGEVFVAELVNDRVQSFRLSAPCASP